MPITPRFSIDQSDDFINITIHVPHIRVSSSELHVEGKDFTFYCKPYFLKLTLPHEIYDDDDTCKAVYDPDDDKGVIRVCIPKREPGLRFPDLDLHTQLLQLRRDKDQAAHAFPSIEVLGEESSQGGEQEDQQELERSSAPASCPFFSATRQNFYGFNSKYTQVLQNLREETAEMTSLPDPESMTLASRQALRLQSETADFDVTRYLGDLMGGEEDYLYQAGMGDGQTWQWEKHWALWKAAKEGGGGEEGKQEGDGDMREEVFRRSGGFSQEETDTMRGLPNKQYLIAKGSSEERLLLLGLADILFAYCYDHRLTQGEPTVESPYTVATLSPTLSFFEVYVSTSLPPPPPPVSSNLLSTAVQNMTLSSHSECSSASSSPRLPLPLQHVLVQSGRRCLIYPYLRLFKLAKKIYTDVTKILLLGQRAVLRCLLQIKKIFERTDTHYLLNKLYVDDYCIWLQSLGGGYGDEVLSALGREYNTVKRAVTKESLGLNLVEIEKMQYQEEEVEEKEEGGEQSHGQQKDEEHSSGLSGSIKPRHHPGITVLNSSSSSSDEEKEDEDDDESKEVEEDNEDTKGDTKAVLIEVIEEKDESKL